MTSSYRLAWWRKMDIDHRQRRMVLDSNPHSVIYLIECLYSGSLSAKSSKGKEKFAAFVGNWKRSLL